MGCREAVRARAAGLAWLIGMASLAIDVTVPATRAATAWPLKVSPTGRHLVDQNGKPFLYTADTSWMMLSMLTVEDARKYIDLRKSQGFNAIQTIATGWRRSGRGPRGVFFEGGDVTQPNEAYFAGVDEIIAYAQTQDVLLSVGLLWLADNGGWAGGTPVPTSQFAQYAKWLGTRYQAQGNLVWFLGGDEEITVQIEATQAAAAALKAADPEHLITYHPRSKAFELRSDGWLAYHSFQWNANSPPYSYQDVRNGYELIPVKPVLDAEPAYDPHPCCGTDPATTPQKVRRNGWWAVLSGAMGVVYGGPSETWNIGNSPKPDWKAVARPAAVHTGNIRKILEPLAWNLLIPDFHNNTVIGGGERGGTNYVAAGIASDGSLIAAYTPVASTLRVDLAKLAAPGTAQWFDPASGNPEGAAVPVENHGLRSFTSPGQNSDHETDWVLIVNARKKEGTTESN